MAALRRGNAAALALAYRTYGPDLRWFARTLVRADDEADDVVQTVFLDLPKRLGGFRGNCDVWTWLRTMTRCEALARNRAARRREDLRACWGLTCRRHTRPTPAIERIALERALAKLPEAYRAVLLLREVGGLSHREIAARLEIAENLSSVRLRRARRRLRELL